MPAVPVAPAEAGVLVGTETSPANVEFCDESRVRAVVGVPPLSSVLSISAEPLASELVALR